MLTIGIDMRDLFIAKTGARTYLEEIANALPRAAPQNKYIFLQPKRYERISNNPLGKIYGHLTYIIWKQIELPYLAKKADCNILFCADYTAPLFPSCIAIPVFHDAFFWSNPDHYNRFWRISLDLFTLPAARKAPAIVTDSEYSRKEITSYTGISGNKIHVIPIAPKSSTLLNPSPDRLREVLLKHGIDPKLPYMLHIGVHEKRKNLTRLIEAFAHFLQEISRPYLLVLVGQPGPKQDLDDSRSIKNAIREYHLEDQVILTGYVSDHDLPAFYRGANFFIFPSLEEGFGIPILEAFNLELPVAAANVSSLPEVCGEAAVLFDPYNVEDIKDAMLRLARDNSLRTELISRGCKQASLFNWDKTASKLIRLFEEVV